MKRLFGWLLSILVLSVTPVTAGVVDMVGFNSGVLTDSFNVNIQAGSNPYSLATNGLAGSQGVDLSASTSNDATLVYKPKGFDLSSLTSLDVWCYFKKQPTSAGTTALTLGLAGASNARLSGYNDTATLEDTWVGFKLGRTGANLLQFDIMSKLGSAGGATHIFGNTFTLVDGNWYQLRATFARINATTIRVSGSLYQSDANGAIGALVGTQSAQDVTNGDLAADSEVWAGLNGFSAAGADAYDNFATVARGVDAAAPSAPTALSASLTSAYRVDLAWTDNSNSEDGFVISRATSAAGPFSDIATTAPDVSLFADTSADGVSTYYYRVRAVNTVGASVDSNTASVPPFQRKYAWKNVAIGGGGYITGIYIHPAEPDLVYVRTDVGGFYRWDAVNTRWIPLTDHFTLKQSDYYGGEALALDPNNPDVVYIACGYLLRVGALFKSTDRGAHWTRLPLNNVEMDGNAANRYAGERLVVSPHDSNLLLFGTRSDGLQRSTDGGASWAKLAGIPDSAWTAGTGFASVLFDPQTAGVVYAAPSGSGVWRSADNGGTWAQLAGAPLDVNRMVIGTAGALLVTQTSGVSRYAAGSWTTSVPPGMSAALSAISVNPSNRDDVIVAERNTAAAGSKSYRSTDGGASWTAFSRLTNNTVPWFNSVRLANPAIASMEFDPAVPGRVWFGDFYAVWRTDNINAATPVFTNPMRNLEEMVVFGLAAPASGAPLLSAVADNDGFRHSALDEFPASRFGTYQETYSIAVFAGDPARVVRTYGGRTSAPYHIAISTDGGVSWTNTNWSTAVPNTRVLQLALAATDPNNIVAITDSSLPGGGVPRVTTDGGVTWQTVAGLPNGPNGINLNPRLPLASDPLLADTFYYHEAAAGKVYRSTDKGLNFTEMNAGAPLPTTSYQIALHCLPGAAADLWTCLDTQGLYRSDNGGASFAKISSVSRAYRFAFGKPAPSSTTPTLYLYGAVNGSEPGVFRSLDLGQTWTELTDPRVAMGDIPGVMVASAQEYGLVFIGTHGRGIFYGRPLPTVSISASATAAAEAGLTPATFTISREGDTTEPLTVTFTFTGSATAASDYAAVPLSVIIPAGASSATVTITPLADNLAEGNETVTLNLSASLDYVTSMSPSASLTIADKPFDAWRFAYGLFAATGSDDNDKDGLVNLLEWACGLNPTLSDSPKTAVVLFEGNVVFNYSRSVSAVNAGAVFSVEWSETLAANDWSTTGVSQTEFSNNGTLQQMKAILPAGSLGRRFVRLRVTAPAP